MNDVVDSSVNDSVVCRVVEDSFAIISVDD